METTKEYLDYRGLKTYHNNIKNTLSDYNEAIADALNEMSEEISSIPKNTKLSQLTNDIGFLSTFRGEFNTFEEVPSIVINYNVDYNNENTPINNDFIIVTNSADYPTISEFNDNDFFTFNIKDGVVTWNYNNKEYTSQLSNESTYIGPNNDLAITLNNITANTSVKISNTPYIHGDTITYITSGTVILSNYSSRYLFKYDGVWGTDEKNGWKPLFALGSKSKDSSSKDEVEIGTTTPIDSNIKLFVDTNEDPEVVLDVYNRQQTDTMLSNKVDKVTGKSLSTNDYTTEEKNKLAGIAEGAEVNVQSDWNATSGDAFIKNKPTIPAAVAVKGNAETSYRTGNVNITPANIGLGNVNNTADTNKSVASAAKLTTARTIWGRSFDGTDNVNGNIQATNANGGFSLYAGYHEGEGIRIETLDSSGKWKSKGITILQNGKVGIGDDSPSHKLDVNGTLKVAGDATLTSINGVTVGSSPKFTDTTYSSKSAASGGTDVSLVTTGEKYTWNSKTSNTGTVTSVAVKMNGATKGTVTTSGTIDLGTVLTSHQDISGKADKSATVSSVAYNTTSKKITKTINGTTSDVVTAAKIVTDGGGIKDISGKVDKTTTVNGHALSGNISVTKSDVGLGNVGNFKAVSTAASQGLSTTEKSNARANIGAISQVQLDALTRHTRLTDFDLDVLKQAVADQNLEKYGLKVGDQKTINGYTYVIADLNTMKGTLKPYRLTLNHVGLIVIPHVQHAWNSSGRTDTGANSRGAGYKNCDLHDYLKNTVLPHAKNDLGAANLLAHSKLLTNAINTTGYSRFGRAEGCSSGWEWVAGQYICALSEVQVYGSIVWSSSGYDTGEACRLLEVFKKYSHTEIFGNEYTWLRDIASVHNASYVDDDGGASYYVVSRSNPWVSGLLLFH